MTSHSVAKDEAERVAQMLARLALEGSGKNFTQAGKAMVFTQAVMEANRSMGEAQHALLKLPPRWAEARILLQNAKEKILKAKDVDGMHTATSRRLLQKINGLYAIAEREDEKAVRSYVEIPRGAGASSATRAGTTFEDVTETETGTEASFSNHDEPRRKTRGRGVATSSLTPATAASSAASAAAPTPPPTPAPAAPAASASTTDGGADATGDASDSAASEARNDNVDGTSRDATTGTAPSSKTAGERDPAEGVE